MKHYLSNCWLWLRGFAWLWTREASKYRSVKYPGKPDSARFFVPKTSKRVRNGEILFPEELISYKPGWSPLAFLPVYLFNVGSHVILSGGAVTTWSRAAWDLRQSGNRWGRLLDKAIQAILGDDHGKQSGAVLWGSTPCEPEVRWAVAIGWTVWLVWVFA